MIVGRSPDILKRAVLVLGVVLAGIAVSRAADAPLVRLRDTFARQLLKLERESSPDSPALTKQYAASLRQCLEKARKAGELESLVAAQKEIARFDTTQSVTRGDIRDPRSDVGRLQTSYLAAVARAEEEYARGILSLAEKYDAALESLQKKLTRAAKVEAALEVKQERNALETHPKVSTARFTMAEHLAAAPGRQPGSGSPSRPKETPASRDHEREVRTRHGAFYRALSVGNTATSSRYVRPSQKAGSTTRLRQIADLVGVLKKSGLSSHLVSPKNVNVLSPGKMIQVPTPFVQDRYGQRENPPSRWVFEKDDWYIDLHAQ